MEDKYALEDLQSRDWSYFIEKILEIFSGNILSMNFSEDIKIISYTSHNLTIYKDTYSNFSSNIGCALQRFLQAKHQKHIEAMEKDLAQNYNFIDLKNEQNAENMRVFAEFFFTFGRFPGTIDHLPIIQTGETPNFLKKATLFHPPGCSKSSTMETREH